MLAQRARKSTVPANAREGFLRTFVLQAVKLVIPGGFSAEGWRYNSGFKGHPAMTQLPDDFLRPPPENWVPQPGDRVRLLFRGKVFDAVVTSELEGGGFVVSGDSLLLPVVCTRDLLRPVDVGSE